MEQNKIAAYLGFARRAGKITFGVQAAATVKRDVFLLVADDSVAPGSRKEIEKLQKRFSCPLLFLPDLEGLTGKSSKLAAVRDEHLAKAILLNQSER